MKTNKRLVACALVVLFVAASFSMFRNDFKNLDANAATNTPTGIMSIVSNGTSASSWQIGPNPDPIGTSFQADVRIDNASGIWGWVMAVNWNSSVLQLESVSQGPYLEGINPTTGVPTHGTYFIGGEGAQWDNTTGTTHDIACDISDSLTTTESASSGVLCTLTFDVEAYGTTSIYLSDHYLEANSAEFDNGTVVQANNATVTIVQPNSSQPGQQQNSSCIDVFTNHGGVGQDVNSSAYAPLDLVQMYALVTYNNASVANQAVSFCVQNSNGTVVDARVVETNSTGIAYAEFRMPLVNSTSTATPGIWSITALANFNQTSVSDITCFYFGYSSGLGTIQIPSTVHKLDYLNITIPINNLTNSTVWSDIDITLFDSAQQPIGSAVSTNHLTAQVEAVNASIFIPDWAFTGEAKIYICLLTSNGTAAAVEGTASFEILPPVDSSTSSDSNSLDAPMVLFQLPEYAWGALISLISAFAGLAAFKVYKKTHRYIALSRFSS